MDLSCRVSKTGRGLGLSRCPLSRLGDSLASLVERGIQPGLSRSGWWGTRHGAEVRVNTTGEAGGRDQGGDKEDRIFPLGRRKSSRSPELLSGKRGCLERWRGPSSRGVQRGS